MLQLKPVVYILTLAAIILPFGESQSCTENAIRLVGGFGDYEGNVQLCYNGKWGGVCDNSWNIYEAQVVCRQLGYSSESNVVEYRRYSYYGYGTLDNVLDYVTCDGTETQLTNCSSTVALGEANCGKGEMGGVFCGDGGTCTHGDIRLANGYVSSYGRGEGRVEVCNSGTWATVCAYPSYTWNTADSRVACKQLGFTSTNVNTYYNGGSKYGYGFLTSAFYSVGCSGSENSLFDCNKQVSSYCPSHYYDAGVRCYSADTGTNCVTNDVRLFSAFDDTPANEGVLQICTGGTWYTVCRYYYSCYVAKTACQQLGYKGAIGIRTNGGFWYGYSQYNDNYRYYCNSISATLSSCSKYYYSSCGSYNDALGLVCYDEPEVNECTDGDIRLVDGFTDDEGRVEYCYSGTWSPVCSINSVTATLMCQELGYTQFTWGLVIDDERFERSNTTSTFNYLYCSTADVQLSDCTVYTKGGGCLLSPTQCGIEYSLRCYNPGTCTDGSVRIVEGVIEQEGRPEVCVNGVWSSFCQYSWNSIDAFVLCNMLGYDGPNPSIYYNSYFGSGYGPIAYSYVYCQGWEIDIHDCTKTSYPGFTCSSSSVAGVVCKQGCTNGDVRLVGGGFPNEGTVEVCFNNLWGLISDLGWNDADARVVCRQLGHEDGTFTPIIGSVYGKPNKTIHLKDVACVGDEDNLVDCAKTQIYLTTGKALLKTTDVAGVDCIYDEPTPPPCIVKPTIDPNDSCTESGAMRLMKDGIVNMIEGRVEYCNGEFWTPLCSMDGIAASVACKQLMHTQYYWGAVVESGDYGTLLNYSLVQNITCTGSESTLIDCKINQPTEDCLPWCPNGNIGLKCFDSGECTKEGEVRLVDGIIEQEGRIEVCVNGVWGSICDDGWDKTDAHVLCRQMGHPELEPVAFSGSFFGDGQYPIVYSNMACGGWESTINDCGKTMYDSITCPRSKVAGLLCGYDCTDGDVRLVGSEYGYEGVVEICFDNLWGLIEDLGWTVTDAQVVCRQLGYEIEGTVATFTKTYTIPSVTVHSSKVDCTGDEAKLDECTQMILPLKQGRIKSAMEGLTVAGVTCPANDQCISPPIGGTNCINGDVRLSGDNAVNGAGTLEYCYKGLWSGFCILKEREATVACRQLGYTDFSTVSIFTDGRFESSNISKTSLFTNFSCGSEFAQSRLSDCVIFDGCQSNCNYPVGIACSVNSNCEEGAVRLVNGSISQQGRIEVCHNNIWGSICGTGFNYTDAYVVCKELDLGVSEPVVHTNSYFGDGNVPIVYSNMGCQGYENTVLDCSKDDFGSFTCSRDNVAGVTCQDNCEYGTLRLVDGSTVSEGTLQICNYNSWGLISSTGWNDEDTVVACTELGYDSGTGYIDSHFGKPNRAVHLSNVNCDGTEQMLIDCESTIILADAGLELAQHVDIVGVSCTTREAISGESTGSKLNTSYVATIGIISVLFIMSILIVISLAIYVLMLRKSNKTQIQQFKVGQVTMSSLHDTRSIGAVNPAAVEYPNDDEQSYMDMGKEMYANTQPQD